MKTLKKNIRRTFQKSFMRFLSVAALIGLSIFVFIGLFSTGPNMRETMGSEFKETKFADAQVVATDAFTKDDKETLEAINSIKAISFDKQIDALYGDEAIRLISNPDSVSELNVVEGRLAENATEIAVGEQMNLAIGDTVNIKSDDLTETKFKVVGIVRSAEYMTKTELDQTSLADGTIRYFATLVDDAFETDDNVARVLFKGTEDLKAFSLDYSNTVYDLVEDLQGTTQVLTERHQEDLKADLAQNASDIEDAEKQIKDGLEKLAEGKKNANDAIKQLQALPSSAATDEQLKTLENQVKELENQENELVEQEEELKENKSDIQEALSVVDKVSITVEDRSAFSDGYSTYGSSAVRMDALSLVLPIIFFAIALMVSFTTMRRMVAEKREEMGVLRALGYYKTDTIKVFTWYSTSAAILGTVLGAVLGTYLLPQLIYNIFADGSYQIGEMMTVYQPWLILASLLLALAVTLLTTYWSARQELHHLPKDLLAKKAPAKTNRIFLEKIPFIWKRISFTNKVTLRNTFRYKSRMAMTILGVMGSISLLILGLGIRDSLSGLAPAQYDDITRYDLVALYNPNSAQADDYRQLVENESDSSQGLYYETFTSKTKELNDSQTIQVFVSDDFSDYVKLDANLVDDGAIITEKLAKTFNVKVGNKFEMKDSQGNSFKIKVSGITENYVGHMIYLKPHYYEEVFGKDYVENAFMIEKDNKPEVLAETLNDSDAGLTVIQSQVLEKQMNNFLEGLTSIIFIMVVVSLMLVFIVLFTLTSINVAEREKELATIKVLGFYQKEALMYIFKETFILTFIGIFFGIGFGYLIHAYVMNMMTPESVMSIPGITWKNVAISTVSVVGFTLIVMLMMNRHIRKINMLEALKEI